MDSSVAPSLANLFMVYLEIQIVCNPEWKPFHNSILKNGALLYVFNQWVNHIYDNIKFSFKSHLNVVAFKNTVDFRDHNDQLNVHLFIKLTDKNYFKNFYFFPFLI